MKSISFICLLIIANLFIGYSFANDSIKGDEITCTVCSAIVGYAEQYVTENATEQELIKLLDDVCDLLPSKYGESCVETINNYGVLIIRLLINKEEPGNICKMLELCPSSLSSSEINTRSVEAINSPIKSGGVLGGMFCPICRELVDGMEGMGIDAAMGYLKEETKKMCDMLPSFLSSDCYNYIIREAQDIIDMIEKNAGPDEICTAIDLC
ncbi:hypothetical protein ACTA71_002017 [Dictyostelium dimigraforme]